MHQRTLAWEAVYDNMQTWATQAENVYTTLFGDPPADDNEFYQNMVSWRDGLYAELNAIYPSPDPEQLFCDDMIQWRGVLDDVLQGPDFPSGPDPENDQVLAALRQTLDEQFGELFPTQIPGEWTTTTAHGSLWANYRIDERGNLGGSEFPIKAECYRPRLGVDVWNDHKFVSGIDCSGFVQRCAAPGHQAFNDMGGRLAWDDLTPFNPPAINTHRLVHGYQGSVFSDLIGNYDDTRTFHRIAPGDVIVRIDVEGKADHVAIVQYITGERGNDEESSDLKRDELDIFLIQAISSLGDDPDMYLEDDRRDGQVTDTWSWKDMSVPAHWHARRLRP